MSDLWKALLLSCGSFAMGWMLSGIRSALKERDWLREFNREGIERQRRLEEILEETDD